MPILHLPRPSLGNKTPGRRDVLFCGGEMCVSVRLCVLQSVFAHGILKNHIGPLI